MKNNLITWTIWLLVLIGMGVATYSIGRVDAIQNNLVLNYVQKADYKDDIREIKDSMKELTKKVDRLLTR